MTSKGIRLSGKITLTDLFTNNLKIPVLNLIFSRSHKHKLTITYGFI